MDADDFWGGIATVILAGLAVFTLIVSAISAFRFCEWSGLL